MILRASLVVVLGAIVSCSEPKPSQDFDKTSELMKLAEGVVGDMHVVSIEQAHSHSSIHSEVQLTADVSAVKFDRKEDAQKITENVREVFENAGYASLFLSNQSQGYDREIGVEHIGSGGWSGSGDSYFDPSLGIDRHVGSAAGSGDVFIRERLRISGIFRRGDDHVAFHFWLFPEEGKCYASLSIINQG